MKKNENFITRIFNTFVVPARQVSRSLFINKKLVFSFGNEKAEGRANPKILGNKGYSLHVMTKLGLPVPPGFTISSEVCAYAHGKQHNYPSILYKQVNKSLKMLEAKIQRNFGDANNPLLVSVRSGAEVSMPGMMDTILNLGLNDLTVDGLSIVTHNPKFAFDSYRRLIAMYGNIVFEIPMHEFEKQIDYVKNTKKLKTDSELDVEDLKHLVDSFKEIIIKHGNVFPQNPLEQLWGAINAVFDSWMNPRAQAYRKLHAIPENIGTAVTVQSMVFGNKGNKSGTGVAFTRNPATGENNFYGEYLINAQGEDVVAGTCTPQPLNSTSQHELTKNYSSLEYAFPFIYKQLTSIGKVLEKHFKSMQDIEFTIEQGQLFILQTRAGKCSGKAAVKIALDMVHEQLITKKDALLHIRPEHLDELLHPRLDPRVPKKVIAKGLPASPGAASGVVVFDAKRAQELVEKKAQKVILVRQETSPEDIQGMIVAQGILTARGGLTSHAAVVARGMGKCCVAGCNDININEEAKLLTVDKLQVKEGDYITLDGSNGEVILGVVPTVDAAYNDELQQILQWTDEVSTLEVRANADTPQDAQVARELGAKGVGLCRTEHMFFAADRIDTVREMILADAEEPRQKALEKIIIMQKQDFIGIMREMQGLPVTIRLIDPPLHEFIPNKPEEVKSLAKRLGMKFEVVLAKVESLKEFNPMLGHRGCRLGVSYPEIYRAQVRAIVEAACALKSEGIDALPEIMIPLISDAKELKYIFDYCEVEIKSVLNDLQQDLHYSIGTMIEIPRAALLADQIAEYAEFFSFGTNDLTQTTFGLSRDDSNRFLPKYIELKIYSADPFATLDKAAVGELMRIAIKRGKSARSNLKCGICGEHGGDPKSIQFCYELGLDYVSCSPYRVPVAKLAAAQATLKAKGFAKLRRHKHARV